MRDPDDPEFPVRLHHLIALALPAMGAQLLQHLYRPVDQYFVQDLGPDAQGALGAASFVVIAVYGLVYLVSGGVAPHVARATGGKDPSWRRKVVAQSLTAGVLIAVVVGFLGFFFADSVPYYVGLKGRMAEWCADYLKVLAVTGGALVLAPTVDGALNAMGKTRLPLALHLVALSLNIVLTPTFLHLGYGVGGAALASTVSQTLTVVAGIIWLVVRLQLKVSDFVPTKVLLGVVNTGLPVGVSIALFAISYQALLKLAVEPLGPNVFAALGIGFSALESMTWPIFVGYSIAVATLVGQALGAQRVDEAKRAVRLTLIPSTVTGLAAGALFFFAGESFVRVFSHDERVVFHAIGYAQVLAWSQPFVALEAAFEGVLSGSGATRVLFWVTVPTNLLRVPIGWYLSMEYGAFGVWWAINITSMLKAAIKGAVVAYGGWTKVKLKQ